MGRHLEATPHVSAVAALLKSYDSSLTNVQIRQAMAQTAYDLGLAGRDNAYGYGLVQAYAAWAFLGGSSNMPPVAAFSYTCTGLTCNFDASGSNDPDGTITNYAWNFGDDSAASGATADHTYAADGVYNVTLTVTDDDGATDTDSQPVSVSSGSGGMMHVSAIDMSYTRAGRNYTVRTQVTVVDATNAPVSGATVAVRTTLPTGAVATGSSVTGTDGKATFSVTSKATGLYTSEVTNVTHATLAYDAGANVETSDSITVP